MGYNAAMVAFYVRLDFGPGLGGRFTGEASDEIREGADFGNPARPRAVSRLLPLPETTAHNAALRVRR